MKTGNRCDHNDRIYYSALCFVAYGCSTVSYCNDFLAVFLSLELISVSSFVLLVADRRIGSVRSVIRYVSFSAVGTIIILYGMAAVYTISGVVDFLKLKPLISSSVISPAVLVVVVLGILIKFVSIPAVSVYQSIYSKLPYNGVYVFMVLIKSSYTILVFNFVVKLF
jgi:NADH-quinone oxidoreductase subunit N